MGEPDFETSISSELATLSHIVRGEAETCNIVLTSLWVKRNYIPVYKQLYFRVELRFPISRKLGSKVATIFR